MPWCHVCGAEERQPDRFHRDTTLLRPSRRICPSCRAHRETGIARRRGRRIVIGLAVGLSIIGLGRLSSWLTIEAVGWTILNAATFLILTAVLIVPHELAHAVMARTLGMNVYRIAIGTGRQVWRSTLAGIDVRLNAIPWSGGNTLHAAPDAWALRLRTALVAIAGPAVHVILLGIALTFGAGEGLRAPWSFQPALAFVLANGFLLAVNLFPWHPPTPGGVVSSDGLLLVRAPFLQAEELTHHLAARYATEAMLLSEEGRFEGACATARDGVAAHPDSPLARLNLGLMLALAGRCDQAREAFREALDLPGVPLDSQAALRNNIAWASLMLEDLEEADAQSARAIEQSGWMPALQGTRGAVLVARGRIGEGLTLLGQALERPEQRHPMARATYDGATAQGLAMQGAMAEAELHLARAREAFPSCPFLPRVERALRGGATCRGQEHPVAPPS